MQVLNRKRILNLIVLKHFIFGTFIRFRNWFSIKNASWKYFMLIRLWRFVESEIFIKFWSCAINHSGEELKFGWISMASFSQPQAEFRGVNFVYLIRKVQLLSVFSRHFVVTRVRVPTDMKKNCRLEMQYFLVNFRTKFFPRWDPRVQTCFSWQRMYHIKYHNVLYIIVPITHDVSLRLRYILDLEVQYICIKLCED